MDINKGIYIDNNATTRIFPSIFERISIKYEESYANPSSAHSLGAISRDTVEEARTKVGKIIGADPEQVYFCSSGSEANTWVLHSFICTNELSKKRIVTTRIEHSSIKNLCTSINGNSIRIDYIDVDRNGVVNLDHLQRLLFDPADIVSVQWVNNETGVVQPIEKIANLCRKHNVTFHTDAAQAVGKVPIDVSNLPIDFLSYTAHKIHGPTGIGGLYSRKTSHLKPLIYGGTQEDSLRGGTENLIGIIGFGEAAEERYERLDQHISHMQNIRDCFESELKRAIPECITNCQDGNRVCNTSNVLFPSVDGLAIISNLDRLHIYCSQSSACTNQIPEPSYVLREIGMSYDDAFSSIRFSFSIENTLDQITTVVNSLVEIYYRLLKLWR